MQGVASLDSLELERVVPSALFVFFIDVELFLYFLCRFHHDSISVLFAESWFSLRPFQRRPFLEKNHGLDFRQWDPLLVRYVVEILHYLEGSSAEDHPEVPKVKVFNMVNFLVFYCFHQVTLDVGKCEEEGVGLIPDEVPLNRFDPVNLQPCAVL